MIDIPDLRLVTKHCREGHNIFELNGFNIAKYIERGATIAFDSDGTPYLNVSFQLFGGAELASLVDRNIDDAPECKCYDYRESK